MVGRYSFSQPFALLRLSPDGPNKLAPVGHRSIFLGFVQNAHDDKPQGIIICDQESLDSKTVYTNDLSYDHVDQSSLWDEPIGVRNDDYCVFRDEEWEGPEPPFFVACDDEVRTPPPACKSGLWTAYREFSRQKKQGYGRTGNAPREKRLPAEFCRGVGRRRLTRRLTSLQI